MFILTKHTVQENQFHEGMTHPTLQVPSVNLEMPRVLGELGVLRVWFQPWHKPVSLPLPENPFAYLHKVGTVECGLRSDLQLILSGHLALSLRLSPYGPFLQVGTHAAPGTRQLAVPGWGLVSPGLCPEWLAEARIHSKLPV